MMPLATAIWKFFTTDGEEYVHARTYLNYVTDNAVVKTSVALTNLLEEFPETLVRHNQEGRIIGLRTVGCMHRLPEVPDLKWLYCSGCPHIVELPDLPKLRYLDCTNCPRLVSIGHMPQLQMFHCANCARLTQLPDAPGLQIIACLRCPLLAHLPNYPVLRRLSSFESGVESEGTAESAVANSWVAAWQQRGLMPLLDSFSGRRGYLVWKHVSPDMVGNKGFPYVIDTAFRNDGMCCAGPFGAIKHYDRHPGNSHLLAICAHVIAPVDLAQGTFYVYEGTPMALYRATNCTVDGADLTRVQGAETPEMTRLWECA